MIHEVSGRSRCARVIVVGNEKGGSGKSTVAMHVAIALIKSGRSVATIDLDSRQRSFTRYIENRKTWAQQIGRDLATPSHVCLAGTTESSGVDDSAASCKALRDAVDELAPANDFIVIDTPGHDGDLSRLAHAMADTLITPLNDSFVDFDVLGVVEPENFTVTGTSHYAQMVEGVRAQRQLERRETDWIVLRNRLSTFGTSRNRRLVGAGLQDLAKKLDFRFVDGLAERLIFREYFPRGLTAVDDLDEITLGTRPTMSHATARLEMENLLAAIGLPEAVQDSDMQARDAA